MTHAGFATVLFRFAGLAFVGAVLIQILAGIFVVPEGRFMAPLLLYSGLLLVPGVIAIVASKPLGRLLAAGLD
ncbi:MAG: hypothetical protein AAF660_13080 [Pseudomonadota bacterium]